jgi:hypothetical protein
LIIGLLPGRGFSEVNSTAATKTCFRMPKAAH